MFEKNRIAKELRRVIGDFSRRGSSLFGICVLALVSSSVFALDCNLPSNYSEQAICGNRFLIELDAAMNDNYKFMLNSNIGDGARHDLRSTQRNWISTRNHCRTEGCITELYKNRLTEMCDYPVISGVHPICSDFDDILRVYRNTTKGEYK